MDGGGTSNRQRTVVVPAAELSAANLAYKQSRVWGTDVYTSDSDLVCVLAHMGFIEISSDVTAIEPYAFSSCPTLLSVVVPTSVISIDDYAFNYCSGLSIIHLPTTIASLGDGAFLSSDLFNVVLPTSVTTIGDYCFHY